MTISITSSNKDNDILYFSKKIDIANKRITTPIYILHDSLGKLHFPQNKTFIYETWKSLNLGTIKESFKSPELEVKFSQKVNSQSSSIDISKNLLINFLQITLDEKNTLDQIKDKEIQFLIDSLEAKSNFLTIPKIGFPSNYTYSTKLDSIKQYYHKSIEIAQTFNTNKKPIIVLIPKLLSYQISDFVEDLLKKDIMYFCFDFQGYSISNMFPQYKEFLRTFYLRDKNIFNEIVIQSINLNNPSNMNRGRPFPAHDLINPAMASDIIGLNHIARGGNGENKKNSKKGKKAKSGKQGKKSPQKINLINTSQYCYNRIQNVDDFFNNFPDKTPINESIFEPKNNKERIRFRREFNSLYINQEFDQIQQMILNNESIVNYLQNKELIKSEFRNKVMGTNQSIKLRKLQDFI